MITRWSVILTCAAACMLGGCVTRVVRDPELPPPEYIGATEVPPSPVIAEREPPREPPDLERPQLVEPIELLTDQAVADAVRDELAELVGVSELAPPPVDVVVERGVVVLSGVVPTGLHALRAVERTETVRGVRSVVNRLEIAPAPLTDEQIESRILARMAEEPAVEAFELSAASELGRVKLTGVVQSYTEKQIAGDLVWSVPGVRNVVNEIQVAPRAVRDDRQIRGDVVARIERNAYLSDDPVEVAVNEGIVLLSGAVGTLMEKRLARTMSWVTGVRAVEDDALVVNPAERDLEQRAAKPVLTDNQLADAVRDALRFDPRVPEDAISVVARAGIVTLNGIVPQLVSKRAAEQDAANTVGVWKVESRIVVSPPKPFTDAALVTLVRKRLTENPGIDVRKVIIEADEGRVEIRGEAESRVESLAIERIVERTPGVVAVSNALRVMEPLAAVRDDAMLERDIEAALWWDPRVDMSQVDIEVENGVAVILGKVPNRAMYEVILENVWQARPRGVENRLLWSDP